MPDNLENLGSVSLPKLREGWARQREDHDSCCNLNQLRYDYTMDTLWLAAGPVSPARY